LAKKDGTHTLPDTVTKFTLCCPAVQGTHAHTAMQQK